MGVYASDYSRYTAAADLVDACLLRNGCGADAIRRVARGPGPLGLGNRHGERVQNIRDDVLGGGAIGALAMVAMALGTVSVNVMNDYTGSLSLQAAGVDIQARVGRDRRNARRSS